MWTSVPVRWTSTVSQSLDSSESLSRRRQITRVTRARLSSTTRTKDLPSAIRVLIRWPGLACGSPQSPAVVCGVSRLLLLANCCFYPRRGRLLAAWLRTTTSAAALLLASPVRPSPCRPSTSLIFVPGRASPAASGISHSYDTLSLIFLAASACSPAHPEPRPTVEAFSVSFHLMTSLKRGCSRALLRRTGTEQAQNRISPSPPRANFREEKNFHPKPNSEIIAAEVTGNRRNRRLRFTILLQAWPVLAMP